VQSNPFDRLADRYDAWYDSDEGSEIFAAEVACVAQLLGEPRGRWLDVGVGTGRFAKALGIVDGLEPSLPMLSLAAARGIRGVVGRGESLPYPDSRFDGVLLIVTICFLDDPVRALSECARVLTKDGSLVLGMVPADSPWGRFYQRKGREGHPFYAIANFYSCEEVIQMAGRAGLVLDEAMSCLFGAPRETGNRIGGPRSGLVPNAGFVGLRFSLREEERAASSDQPLVAADP
jgi:ubiquinone/menaquinone biosynthesis C-methylase UbiE